MPDPPHPNPMPILFATAMSGYAKRAPESPSTGNSKASGTACFTFQVKRRAEISQQALKRKLENEDFDFRGVWFPCQTVVRAL